MDENIVKTIWATKQAFICGLVKQPLKLSQNETIGSCLKQIRYLILHIWKVVQMYVIKFEKIQNNIQSMVLVYMYI
jgi:hypothetical protein